MKLFHGTTAEAKAQIEATGVIEGPVFLTADFDAAAAYAGDEDNVIEVDVAESALLVDLDLPGAKLLTVEDAAEYLGESFDTIEQFIDRGYSVATESDVRF